MINRIFQIVIFLLLVSCSGPRVIVFLNDDLDYSKYDSYRLINYKSDDKSFSEEGTAFFNTIEASIEKNMTDKQYEKVDRPDLIVRYEVVSTMTSESQTRGQDPYNYNNPYYYSPPSNQVKYTEGVVLIEFRDRKRKKLVWQGSLDLKYSKKKSHDATIEEAIDKIFTSYPYQAGSKEKIVEEQN